MPLTARSGTRVKKASNSYRAITSSRCAANADARLEPSMLAPHTVASAHLSTIHRWHLRHHVDKAQRRKSTTGEGRRSHGHRNHRDRHGGVVNVGSLCLREVRHHYQATGRQLNAETL